MTIRFTSRNDAFADYPHLARFVRDWQMEAFDPEQDRFEAGDEIFMELNDDEAVVLTAELADELNQERDDEFAALCDTFDASLPSGRPATFMVAEPPGATMDESASLSGAAFATLCRSLGCDEVAILPITRTPILSQNNDHSDAASKALKALGLKQDFDGAIVGAPETIAPFIGPLFWIARCNASAPNITLGLAGTATTGLFCEYLNIHFSGYDAGEEPRLLKALHEAEFTVAEDGQCHERFSETGMIEGRRLDLGL